MLLILVMSENGTWSVQKAPLLFLETKEREAKIFVNYGSDELASTSSTVPDWLENSYMENP